MQTASVLAAQKYGVWHVTMSLKKTVIYLNSVQNVANPFSVIWIIKNHYLKAVKANEHARLVQTWFKSLGYNIDIDGSYGNNSANVCKEFQKSKGLTIDGICGLDTHKDLIKALKEDKDNHIYYRVITGSYTERANANEEVEKLKALGYNPFLVAFEKDGVTYLRVVALSTNDRSEADKHVANLKTKGYSAFISVFTK